MKLAIFSDVHDNVPNLEIFIKWINKNDIREVIFCGDLCDPVLIKEVIVPNFNKKIHMVFGNGAYTELMPKMVKNYDNVCHYGDIGEVEIDKIKIGLTHKPKDAKEMAESGKFDYVFYGHTHKPWEETINKCMVINPGTLGGVFYKATFAIFDTKSQKLELKLLERL